MYSKIYKGIVSSIAIIIIINLSILTGCNKSSVLDSSYETLTSYPIHEKTLQESSALIEFIKSDDFKREFIEGFKGLDRDGYNIPSSYVAYYTSINNKQIPILYLAIELNKKIVGFVIGMKMPDSYKKLSNNSSYMISLRDYSNYDLKTKSGYVKDYDLNNDYTVGELNVKNGKVITWNAYIDPKVKPVIVDVNSLNKGQASCDTNLDGDISFGECYKCMKDACSTNGECMALCDILGFGSYCSATIGVSCVYIACRY